MTSHETAAARVGEIAEITAAEIEYLRAVEAAAHDLITTGLVNRGTGLMVVEARDKTDPHYRLCDLIEKRRGTRLTGGAR